MTILHIASIDNKLHRGVSVAVPQHIRAQQELENVALLNITDIKIPDIQKQFSYGKQFRFSSLTLPFSKPDIVVFHEVYCADYLRLSKQLVKENIPYIIVPHGSLTRDAQHKKYLKKTAANFFIFNSFIKKARALQFLSQREMSQSAFRNRAFVGTNGVFLPNVKKTEFHMQGVKLLYIGRLEMQSKGLDIMLEAVSLISEELHAQGAKLYIYGPDYKSRYADMQNLIAKMDVGDLVKLGGVILGEEKQMALLDADIFIQTSRSEGMPMGILEAMGYGVPCLVTEGTNLGRFIKEYDAGWVAHTDAKSIAQIIQKAIAAKDDWALKSKNAVNLIEENFLWRKVAQETIQAYKEVFNS